MSAGSGVFDLEADPSKVLGAMRSIRAEMEAYDRQLKSLQKGTGDLTEEEAGFFDFLAKKIKELRGEYQAFEGQVRALTRAQKEAGGGGGSLAPSLIDENFKRQAAEIDDIRRQRMAREGQERAQQEVEIGRITAAARKAIQDQIEGEALLKYQQDARLTEGARLAEEFHKQLMNDKALEQAAANQAADAWIISTGRMFEAERRRFVAEEQEIETIGMLARSQISAEERAEAERHFDVMQHRKDERQIIEALSMLSAGEAQKLYWRGGATGSELAGAAQQRNPNMEALTRQINNASSSGMRWREVMTQVSYGLSDMMAASGGAAEKIRAVANNAQYAAMMIPGPWGHAINVLTLGVQAISQLAPALLGSTEAMKKQNAEVEKSTEFYREMFKELDKLTMKQDEFEVKYRRIERTKKVGEEREAIEAQKQDLQRLREELEKVPGGVGAKEVAAVSLPALAYGVFTDPKGTVNRVSGTIKQQLAQYSGEPGMNDQRKILEQQIANAGIRLKDAQKAAEEGDRLRAHDVTVEEGTKFIAPGRAEFSKVYQKDVQERGVAAAVKHLEEIVRGELPEKLRGATAEIANKLAGEATEDLRGKRFVAQFDGRTATEKARDEAKEKADEARRGYEVQRLQAEQANPQHMPQQAKQFLKALEQVTEGLEHNYKVLRDKAEKEDREDKDKLLQQPAPVRPPPLNRRGNI